MKNAIQNFLNYLQYERKYSLNTIESYHNDLINFQNIDITGISYNSKTTKKGDIFICLPGEYSDGHDYAKSAVENGASALLVERKVDVNNDIPQVVVASTRHQIADHHGNTHDHQHSRHHFQRNTSKISQDWADVGVHTEDTGITKHGGSQH